MKYSSVMALDPQTRKIYLGSAEFEPAGQAQPGQRPPRPKVIPGTFKILIYGPGQTVSQ